MAGEIEVYSAGHKYGSPRAYQTHRQERLVTKPVEDPQAIIPEVNAVITVAGVTFDPSQGKTVEISSQGVVREDAGVGRPDLGMVPSDFSSKIHVRGGGLSDNSIHVDNMEFPNPYHFGGILSMFDDNLIKNFTLFSGAIPSTYNNAASSVLDFKLRQGSLSRI